MFPIELLKLGRRRNSLSFGNYPKHMSIADNFQNQRIIFHNFALWSAIERPIL